MDLRVMTFNIRNGLADDGPNAWPFRRDLTASAIRESDADVIGLQEVFDFQLSFLLEELPGYRCYSVGRQDGGSSGEHCSILWREDVLTRQRAGTFWLSDTPDVPNSMTWGNRITRICSWVEFVEGFTFYNTHWDHESALAREKSADLILDVLPSTPWILVGDFNAEPSFAELEKLASRPGLEWVTRDHRHATFHGFHGGSEGEIIDHIFVSPGLAASEFEVLNTKEGGPFPSDHYPVTTTVSI